MIADDDDDDDDEMLVEKKKNLNPNFCGGENKNQKGLQSKKINQEKT